MTKETKILLGVGIGLPLLLVGSLFVFGPGLKKNFLSVAPSGPIPLSQEEIRGGESALETLKRRTDDMTGATVFMPQETLGKRILCYIGTNAETVSALRLRMAYAGKDWIFLKDVMVKIGEDVSTIQFRESELKQKVGINPVQCEETVDIDGDPNRGLLAKIGNAQEVKLRFHGREGSEDIFLTESETSSIKNVLAADFYLRRRALFASKK